MNSRKPHAPFRRLPTLGRRLSAPASISSENRGFLLASRHSADRLATPRDHANQDASKPTSATQHLLSTTSTRASWIPDYGQSRDFRLVLVGGPSISRCPIRFGGLCCLVSCGAFSSPVCPRASEPYLWHLCRLPISEQWRFRTHCSSSGPPRLLSPRVREDHTMSTTRSAFHRPVIAPSGSAPSFIDPATLPPRFDSRRSFARRAPLHRLPHDWLVLDALGSRPRKHRPSS